MSNFPRAPFCDFPSAFLKWMKQNAAPKMAVKLMKCHKYFQHFPEFPYFVVKLINYFGDDDKWQFLKLDGNVLEYEGAEGIEKITKKLWITKEMNLFSFPKPLSCFIPKIAVCDIQILSFLNQEIFYKEFEFLTSSGKVEVLQLTDTTIKLENSGQLFFVDILRRVRTFKHFHYYNFPLFLPNTFRDIDTSKLEVIGLTIINYSTFKNVLEFMDHNPHIAYWIYFLPNSLHDAETKIIKNYIQLIIDTGITKYPPPYIEFSEQSIEQRHALNILINQYTTLKNNKKLNL